MCTFMDGKRFLLFVSAGLVPLLAFAQDKLQVEGIIYDGQTGQRVPFASVTAGKQGTVADRNGCYLLKGVDTGHATLTVSCMGYESAEKRIPAGAPGAVRLDFRLAPAGNPLDEVVVTGTRTGKRLRDTPVLTKVVTEKDIARLGNVTAMDAIQDVIPGITFSPDAHGANMKIQGLDNDYVLVLLDGERLVGETRGNVNLDRIEAADIQRIEIVNGSSSVLYGSNAIGGVINIITRKPTKTSGGRIGTRYSKYNTSHSSVSVETRQDKLGLKLKGFRNSSDGYDLTPDSPESYTASPYVDWSGGGTVSYDFSRKFTVKAKGDFFRHDTHNPPKSLSSVHGRHTNLTLGAEARYRFNEKHSLSLNVHDDTYKAYDVYEKLQDSTDLHSDYRYLTAGLLYNCRMRESLEWIAGGELNAERIYSRDLFGTEGTMQDKRKHASDVNFFLQGDWKLAGRLELVGGARYTRHSTFGSHFTPKLSLMYTFGPVKLRGTVATGYKSPSLKELYYNFNHQGMFYILGNKDLKPENSRYFSFSGEYSVKKAFNISGNVYFNRVNNKISSVWYRNKEKDRDEARKMNIDKVEILGFEGYVTWSFLRHLKLKAGYAWTDAVDKSTGLQIYGNSKHTANTSLIFHTNSVHCPFSLTFSGRIASPALFQEVTTEPGTGKEVVLKRQASPYSLWKINCMQHIRIWKNLSADVQLGIDNLFNYHNYKNTTLLDPGRVFWARAAFNF